jgi:hypothetical protein
MDTHVPWQMRWSDGWSSRTWDNTGSSHRRHIRGVDVDRILSRSPSSSLCRNNLWLQTWAWLVRQDNDATGRVCMLFTRRR